MQVFKLHIDGVTKYVRSTPERLRAAMVAHIRAEMAKGRKLSHIEFCWHPLTIGSL